MVNNGCRSQGATLSRPDLSRKHTRIVCYHKCRCIPLSPPNDIYNCKVRTSRICRGESHVMMNWLSMFNRFSVTAPPYNWTLLVTSPIPWNISKGMFFFQIYHVIINYSNNACPKMAYFIVLIELRMRIYILCFDFNFVSSMKYRWNGTYFLNWPLICLPRE